MIENINENSNYEFDMNEKDFDTSYDNEYEKLIFESEGKKENDNINVEKTKEMTPILSKKTRRQKKSDNGKDEHTKYFLYN